MSRIAVVALLLAGLALSGCQVKPQPIRFGEDMCHYCTMTVVERGFAAEVVTKKGKAYKFDAIECMMNHLRDHGSDDIALFLTCRVTQPGELTDAKALTFMRSEAMPSPMGAFLSAWDSEAAARSAIGEAEAEFYDWQGLVGYFSENKR